MIELVIPPPAFWIWMFAVIWGPAIVAYLLRAIRNLFKTLKEKK